jgi:putative methionine-R-sulfoxide reductase with GAF domain
MITRVRGWLVAPVFAQDEDKTRAARLLHGMLAMLLATLILALPFTFLRDHPGSPSFAYNVTLLTGMAFATLSLWLCMRTGRVRLTSILLVFSLWLGVTASIFLFEGVRDLSMPGYFIVIALAGLLLGENAALASGLLCVLSVLAAFFAELAGIIRVEGLPPPNSFYLLGPLATLGMMAALMRFAVRTINEGFARARRSALELSHSNEELRAIRATLETRVKERTQDLVRLADDLQVGSEVAREAANSRNLAELSQRVVNLVQERFGLYYVALYLLDEKREWAALAAATGELGRTLVQAGYTLSLRQPDLIGQVVKTGQPYVCSASARDPLFRFESLLPDTRVQLALPIKAEGQAIGVLDLRSTRPAAFGKDAMLVLSTLADQLAIAIQKTRLLQERTRAAE